MIHLRVTLPWCVPFLYYFGTAFKVKGQQAALMRSSTAWMLISVSTSWAASELELSIMDDRPRLFHNLPKIAITFPVPLLSCRDVKFSRPTWSRGQILRSRSRSRSHDIVLVLMHLGLVASTMHKPNRCRMSDGLLEKLVFLNCNERLQQTVWNMTFYWLFNSVTLIMMSRGDAIRLMLNNSSAA